MRNFVITVIVAFAAMQTVSTQTSLEANNDRMRKNFQTAVTNLKDSVDVVIMNVIRIDLESIANDTLERARALESRKNKLFGENNVAINNGFKELKAFYNNLTMAETQSSGYTYETFTDQVKSASQRIQTDTDKLNQFVENTYLTVPSLGTTPKGIVCANAALTAVTVNTNSALMTIQNCAQVFLSSSNMNIATIKSSELAIINILNSKLNTASTCLTVMSQYIGINQVSLGYGCLNNVVFGLSAQSEALRKDEEIKVNRLISTMKSAKDTFDVCGTAVINQAVKNLEAAQERLYTCLF